MILRVPQIKKVLKDPVTAAKIANLVYVTDKHFTIKRRKQGEKFKYLENNKTVKDPYQLERFTKLVIPPKWRKVSITHLENGHLQVVGRDAKNRKQYRYHPHWRKIRSQTKFFMMQRFGEALAVMRSQMERDLQQAGMPAQKCLALVVKLMEETHIRIGNEYYARKNKTYGLSTLRTRHLDIYKDEMKFNFVGKKGKKHSITLRNKNLQRLVLKCEEIPGWELFQYLDEKGNHQAIDSGMVNDYIRSLGGESFTAKDFRTWAGSKIFFETLYDLGLAENKKEAQKNSLTAFDATAKALGNTRNVARKYYIHPHIVNTYEDGLMAPFFDQLDTLKDDQFISASEKVLLALLGEYTVEI